MFWPIRVLKSRMGFILKSEGHCWGVFVPPAKYQKTKKRVFTVYLEHKRGEVIIIGPNEVSGRFDQRQEIKGE